VRDALQQQSEGTMQEYKSRVDNCKMQLQEQGVNSNLYWDMGENDWMTSDFVPLVPTSAISGEGVQDILWLLCKIAQEKLWQNLMYCANLQCTVLEVKAIDGLGMTVDVIVVNGVIREGDKVVLCSMDGPVVSEIRGLLTPPPSREMRVKADYEQYVRAPRGAPTTDASNAERAGANNRHQRRGAGGRASQQSPFRALAERQRPTPTPATRSGRAPTTDTNNAERAGEASQQPPSRALAERQRPTSATRIGRTCSERE
jgi:translation initiation factor IF-2